MSVLVALLVLVLTPGTSVAAKRLPCSKKGSQTIAANEHSRVFQTDRYDREEGTFHSRLYGCLYSRDRSLLLDRTDSEDALFVQQIRLVGRAVGFAAIHFGGSVSDLFVASYDLGSKQLLQRESIPREPSPPVLDVLDLEMSSSGAIAYILGAQTQLNYWVRKLDASGCPSTCPGSETVDSSPDIAKDSLALSGSTFYWTKAGSPRSSSLGGSGEEPRAPRTTRQPDRRCSLKGSKTVAATSGARVYKKADREGNGNVYGCLYRSERRVTLGFDGDEVDASLIRLVTLAARFVAFEDGYVGRDGFSTTVRVLDLQRRITKHEWGAGPSHQRGEDARTTDLDLTPAGSVGWIVGYRPAPTNVFQLQRYEVRKSDAAGGGVLLDSAADIVPESLALSGSILYWTKGAVPYSATLG